MLKMGFITLLKNLRFLCRKSLYCELVHLKNDVSSNMVDEALYETNVQKNDLIRPDILNVDETLQQLGGGKVSLARFGDGEFNIMEGSYAIGQEPNRHLRNRLIEVFSSPEKEMLIGIPRVLWYSKNGLDEAVKKFWRRYGAEYRSKLNKYIITSYNKVYCSSEITLTYIWYPNMEHDVLFNNFRKLWQHREVVVVSGYDFLRNVKFNIFENAQQVDYFIPENCSGNAWSHYEEILQKCLKYPKDKLFLLILGPTAKVLSYDLFHNGYQAWDLGHLAKSYDWYCQKKTTWERDFFIQDR